MTRTYAARRLLEHGPLSFAEFLEITGWTKRIAWRALTRLIQFGLVEFVNGDKRRLYRIAD